jgi:[NiFe] hydrogenase small subunit
LAWKKGIKEGTTRYDTNEAENNVSRRDFLKFCSAVAAAIGLAPSLGSRVAAALASAARPPILWLHFSECTGCTESVLRTVTPYFDDLIFDTVSLDYHETLMAGAGSAVHEALSAAANKYRGQFFCVVEGAIPTAQNGIFGMINGKTMVSIAQEICPKAKAILAIGNCSSFGGLPAAKPNPTGAKGVKAVFPSDSGFPPIINISGCPPNPVSFVGVIANYLLKGTLPDLDKYLRPLFAYETTVHSQCPLIHTSRCLEQNGCKGPITSNNCPTVKFNGTNFPMNAGHVCIGCSEPLFWDAYTPFWGLVAADAPNPPDPKKDLWPPIGVIRPYRGAGTLPADNHGDADVFDVLGRRVESRSPDKRAAAKKTARAPGFFIEKTERTVRKRIGL